jgi:hypothetical protein
MTDMIINRKIQKNFQHTMFKATKKTSTTIATVSMDPSSTRSDRLPYVRTRGRNGAGRGEVISLIFLRTKI